jgi:hypothetical protein
MDAGVVFCPAHGYGPCPARHGIPATPPQEQEVIDAYPDLPTPTPSDEASEHFLPPGYGPIPGLESPPPTPPAASPFDLNVKDEEAPASLPPLAPTAPASPAAPASLPPPASALATPASPAHAASSPPSPSPEARRLLRRFASAMATHRASLRAGTWSLAALGLSNEGSGTGGSSSSAGGLSQA